MDPTTSGYSLDNRLAGIRSSRSDQAPLFEAASPASDRPDLKALPLRSQEVCCLVQPEKARYPFGSISTTPNPTWRKPWQT